MKKLIFTFAVTAVSLTTFGQDATVLATHPDSINQRCKENNSIYYQLYKQKNYKEAYQPWLDLYTACPSMTKNIYIHGPKILDWKIKNATDASEKQGYFNMLMKLYDDRIELYGTDKTMPKSQILLAKSADYINNDTPDDPLKKKAYDWIAESMNEVGDATDPYYLQYYMWISSNLYRQNQSEEQFNRLLADFNKTTAILEKQIADSAKNAALSKNAAQVKAANDQAVATTGALTGESLDKIYGPLVEKNKADINYLTNTLNLYEKVGATETPVYYKASEYAYTIKPTEASAVGLGNMYLQKKSYSTALKYFEDAVQYSSNNTQKAKYEYMIATIYSSYMNNSSAAREHARKSLQYNPNQGKPYILIGKLYAGSRVSSDPVLAKAVYWVAVDKFVKAKSVDPSCAGEANGLIARYSKYFPEDKEIFMHPDINKGSSYTVGGWIGESTIVR
jgi:hypothetical protein